MEMFYQIAGWIGMVLIVTTYYFVTTGRWGTHTKIDELLNILGSILVGVSVFHAKSWPAFTLQVVWALVAIVSLIRKPRDSSKNNKPLT